MKAEHLSTPWNHVVSGNRLDRLMGSPAKSNRKARGGCSASIDTLGNQIPNALCMTSLSDGSVHDSRRSHHSSPFGGLSVIVFVQ